MLFTRGIWANILPLTQIFGFLTIDTSSLVRGLTHYLNSGVQEK